MTKHHLRKLKARLPSFDKETRELVAELIATTEELQARARRGDPIETPATELLPPAAIPKGPKKKARCTKLEAEGYAGELGLEMRDGEWFWEKMEEFEWIVGKGPVKDWKGRMRQWNILKCFPSQKQLNGHSGAQARVAGPCRVQL